MSIDTTVEHGDSRIRDLFWRKVSIAPNGCWVWTGLKSDDRYGVYGVAPRSDGRSKFVHRFILQATGVSIPPDAQVDHMCHDPAECAGNPCPHRACLNPEHLEVTSARENVLRSGGVAARNARKTHCNRGHALTAENIRFEGSKRRCLTCKSIANRRSR